MNLDYVILYVRDMAQAQAFYTEILGLTVVAAVSSPSFVTLPSEGGAMLGLQDKTKALMPRDGKPSPAASN